MKEVFKRKENIILKILSIIFILPSIYYAIICDHTIGLLFLAMASIPVGIRFMRESHLISLGLLSFGLITLPLGVGGLLGKIGNVLTDAPAMIEIVGIGFITSGVLTIFEYIVSKKRSTYTVKFQLEVGIILIMVALTCFLWAEGVI